MTGRLPWILLAVSLLLTTSRSLVAVRSANLTARTESGPAGPASPDSVVATVARRDALFQAVEPPARDPFKAGPPPVSPAQAAGPARPTAERNEPKPRVVLLLQDGTSTTVQLEVNGATSGHMTVGSRFEGWVVTAITAMGITVSNGRTQATLPRP